MIRNYFKIAWRNLIKNKSFTFINLSGLATGFAITLLIIQYVRFEFSYESTHAHADRIVRLTQDIMDGETVSSQDCETYPPIGPKMKDEIPEVEDFTRVYQIGEPSIPIRVGEQQHILNRLYAVDPSFFSMFSYPLLHGNQEDLFEKPNQAVITETTALKYFNRKNVVGEIIELNFSEGQVLLDIIGVISDTPSNTHLKFDMLMSYATMLGNPTMKKSYGEKEDNWNGNNTFTYVMLNQNTDYESFSNALIGFNKRLVSEGKIENELTIAQKISDIHLYSNKSFEPEPNGDSTSVFFLLGIAFLVIVSAFVNYINLATSKALDRAKEVGIRKVVGSSKNQLRVQFLIEVLLMIFLAAIGTLVLIFVIKEKFIEVSGLPDNFPFFTDMYFWMILTAFIFLGVLFSGVYPAIVLSSFKPSSVLKGSFSHSTSGVFLRKSLVVFQFTITIVLLIQVFTIKEQLNFLKTMDLGVNTNNTIVVKAPVKNNSTQNFEIFKQKLLASSNIDMVSLSSVVPGELSSQMSTTTGINLYQSTENHNYNFYISRFDADFIPLMGLKLIAGTNFDETSHLDKNELIVNEEALRLWGVQDLETIIGKKLRFWDQEWTIKGVIKNYHQESAKAPYVPTICMFSNYFEGLATVKFNDSNPQKQVAQLEGIYKSLFPSSPFSYFFMDSEYDKQYKADNRFQAIFNVLTGFAILIACLGLFGLASFTVLKMKKEIGVRKVIGASVVNILVLLSKNFVKTVLLSVIIGIPITYFLVTNWLKNFAFHIDLNWWLFITPVMLILVLVIITISVKTINAALMNPVKSLKEN